MMKMRRRYKKKISRLFCAQKLFYQAGLESFLDSYVSNRILGQIKSDLMYHDIDKEYAYKILDNSILSDNFSFSLNWNELNWDSFSEKLYNFSTNDVEIIDLPIAKIPVVGVDRYTFFQVYELVRYRPSIFTHISGKPLWIRQILPYLDSRR